MGLWASGAKRIHSGDSEGFLPHSEARPRALTFYPSIISGTVVFAVHDVVGYLASHSLIYCRSIAFISLTVLARNYFSILAMGKTKSAGRDAVKATMPSEVKAISLVKAGAVTKPSQTSKSKSKEIAKQVAVKADKSKKVKKEPTPVSESETSESEELEEASSADSASSDDDSDAESPKLSQKVNGSKSNGPAEALALIDGDSETSDSSASSEDDDEVKPTADLLSAAKAPEEEATKNPALSDESSEGSSDESDDEDEAVPGATELDVKLEKETLKVV